jgi:hypothetical protein
MHSMAYSIEGLMATMIAELICLIRYKGAPNMSLSSEWWIRQEKCAELSVMYRLG